MVSFFKALLHVSTLLSLQMIFISCSDFPEDAKPWETDYSVPLDTIPSYYQLSVQPDLGTGMYKGTAVINITVTVKKNHLWLNNFNIDITGAVVTSSLNTEIPIKKTFVYNYFFVIELKNTIIPGDYQLHFQFNGSVIIDGGPEVDVFVVTLDTNNIERRLLYSSLFFPVFGRFAFKCIFDITIVAVYPTKDYRAISNTHIEKVTPNSPKKGMTTVNFARSPKMRYGAAFFMLHNFDMMPTAYTKQHVAVTLYARSAIIKNLQRALETAVSSVDYNCDYINTTFPLKKIDIIIIPKGPDFTATAGFQQYGMAGFSEEFIYYEAGDRKAYWQYFSVSSIAHEMTHATFDESATPAPESELYLKEAHAAYFQHKITKFLHPNWDTTAFIIIYDVYWAMTHEADLTSLPLATLTPSTRWWKAISPDSLYTKGAATFRMLECFMGESNTQQGYRNFMAKFGSKTALVRDLWDTMQPYAPHEVNVTRTMLSWTVQSGYPLLLVNRTGNTLTITQTPFLVDRNDTYNRSESPFLFLWDIPVTLIASNGFQIVQPLWLTLDKHSLTIKLPHETTWAKINTDECNYMRVLYPVDNWKMLAQALQQNKSILGSIDRGDIIDNAFALAESGYISYLIALDMIVYMDQEDSLLPWISLLVKQLPSIEIILLSTPGYKYYQKYFYNKLIRFLGKPIWIFNDDDAPDVTLLKSLYFKYACLFGVRKCTGTAKSIFNKWLQCGRKPHAEIRSTVYKIGVSQGGVSEWNAVWKVYSLETRDAEKEELRNALCHSREPWIITQLLELVKTEELYDFIISCSAPPVANIAVWQYVRQNWRHLAKILEGDQLVLIVYNISDEYSTVVQLKEVEAFFDDISEDDIGEKDRKIILDTIRANIALKEKNACEVIEWFKNAVQ